MMHHCLIIKEQNNTRGKSTVNNKQHNNGCCLINMSGNIHTAQEDIRLITAPKVFAINTSEL